MINLNTDNVEVFGNVTDLPFICFGRHAKQDLKLSGLKKQKHVLTLVSSGMLVLMFTINALFSSTLQLMLLLPREDMVQFLLQVSP